MIIIGLMSGTSADGVDAAVCQFSGWDDSFQWALLHHTYVPYTVGLRTAILDCCRSDAPIQTVLLLGVALAELYSTVVEQAMSDLGIYGTLVDAIACHGQTIWHQPLPVARTFGAHTGSLQIGESSVLAHRFECGRHPLEHRHKRIEFLVGRVIDGGEGCSRGGD